MTHSSDCEAPSYSEYRKERTVLVLPLFFRLQNIWFYASLKLSTGLMERRCGSLMMTRENFGSEPNDHWGGCVSHGSLQKVTNLMNCHIKTFAFSHISKRNPISTEVLAILFSAAIGSLVVWMTWRKWGWRNIRTRKSLNLTWRNLSSPVFVALLCVGLVEEVQFTCRSLRWKIDAPIP